MPGLTQEQVDELMTWANEEPYVYVPHLRDKIRELQAPKKRYVELEEIKSLLAARTFSSCITLNNLDDFFLQLEDYAKTLEELK